ncbi:hypothetical protein A5733_02150 [Mycobacterium sp. NS-7484]|uniref:AAA family ATPase n=1 Tax=Mycobacterium sp. NS-7484 TaxID=1834161 RepID=UPI00096E651B|nr:ATP-binding protein [Mycobacterium sp. NS-7484]OMC02464.1 hypothetical protein A5733_02150 [Mycobacterium sp. NS-7484]
MKFQTMRARTRPPWGARDGAYLEANGWNDYGYYTLWTLYFVRNGETIQIGTVKIADFDDNARPPVPKQFDDLPDQFFSLGQDEDYYESLKALGPDTRIEVLQGLRDIALDLDLFRRVQDLDVTQQSLLRSVKAIAVQTQFHRIAMGGVKLSPYSFSYVSSDTDRDGWPTPPAVFEFDVTPHAKPRTNIHVLIGRNGVGKSFMLNDIATALTRPEYAAGRVDFEQQQERLLTNRFANVVSVTYSAFDSFEPRNQSDINDAMGYQYIGLKQPDSAYIKDHHALADEFGDSLNSVVEIGRLERWRHYLEFLASDTLFAEILNQMVGIGEVNIRDRAGAIFRELSSGHKIVLLILTRLVETVEEASLVLIDEPESHLHPPLLSAFMNALSELLEDRNGVAIIATHSPVVIQEVPRHCVWKLLGTGGVLSRQRPVGETYGENVGTLTQEIFGLEVTAAGFHRTLDEAVASGGDFNQILSDFNGNLGAEAKALLQSMVYFSRQSER